MRLLNVACGSVRPGDPWINLDNLRTQLNHGTPERINLDKEPNYVEHELTSGSMPFPNDMFHGILCSHLIEHFDAQESVRILRECRRVLAIGGFLVVSVPSAQYFLSVLDRDKPENAVELFGEPICPDEPWHKSFFDYALFYEQHKQILTYSSLSCLLIRAGFGSSRPFMQALQGYSSRDPVVSEIEKIMNRRKFSLELLAVKASEA